MKQASGLASVSLDADNLWSYMKTHGDADWAAYPTYLPTLAPRVLEFLGERGLRITFFVVGTDADRAENEDAIASLATADHEIGNHSYRHEPWLHRYSADELTEELTRAETAITRVTGAHPIGFRGPGYSLSADTLRVLADRGYRYDASTLPTFVGPLARAYYFRSTHLSPEQRAERSNLFGSWRDGFRPLRPYVWAVDHQRLTELPVTTMPVLRVPIHASYLIALAAINPTIARGYFKSTLGLCHAFSVEPSLLLHPLDFLDGRDASPLEFFPGMRMSATDKMKVVSDALTELGRRFTLTTVADHVQAIERIGGLRSLDARHSDPTAARR